MQKITPSEYDAVTERCLSAYLEAGTPDLSLDRLAYEVGVTKRMLVHYFGKREAVEDRAITLFEDRLRSRFAPEGMSADLTLAAAVQRLWEHLTAAEFHGELRLILNLYRRAWDGSSRAQTFYAEHRRIWADLLGRYSGDPLQVESLLQLFQGAAMAFLITGSTEPGRLALERLASS